MILQCAHFATPGSKCRCPKDERDKVVRCFRGNELRHGESHPGQIFDVRGRIVEHNPHQPHQTMPFQVERDDPLAHPCGAFESRSALPALVAPLTVATKHINITISPCKHSWSLQTYIHTYMGAPDKRPDKSRLCRSHYLLPPPSGTCSAVTLANVIHSPTSAHVQYSTQCAERIWNASSVQFRFEVWLLLRHGLQAAFTSAGQRSIHFSCSKQHSLQLLKVAVLQQGGRSWAPSVEKARSFL